jgi:hypothetical protein
MEGWIDGIVVEFICFGFGKGWSLELSHSPGEEKA